jgi:hypothetical protein
VPKQEKYKSKALVEFTEGEQHKGSIILFMIRSLGTNYWLGKTLFTISSAEETFVVASACPAKSSTSP